MFCPCPYGYGERAFHRLYAPVESELSDEHVLMQALVCYLPVRSEYADGYGEVECRAFFPYVSRCEVYCDALHGILHPDVCYGREYAALGLSHGVVREA